VFSRYVKSELLEEGQVEDHLRTRGVDPSKIRAIVDEESGTATFLLYNLSGQIVGYQRYTPGAPKSGNSNPTLNRYFTRVTRTHKSKMIHAWGINRITTATRRVYIVEGIFDAVKIVNAGRVGIAILTSNPKFIKEWLSLLNVELVGIQDNDEKRQSGWSFLDRIEVTPDPYKDLGEMPQSEVNSFLDSIENG